MPRALITGCSSGIGRATAIELTNRGFEVVATARDPNSLADLDVAQRHRMDVTDDLMVSDVVRKVGPVDVLVNNAGIGLHGPLEEVPMSVIEHAVAVNFLGAVRVTKAVLPVLRERGNGTVVTVSSPAGRATRPLTGSYGATKAAIELIFESLSFELEATGCRLIMIEPGAVASDFARNRQNYGSDRAPYAEILAMWSQALRRSYTQAVCTPAEVATVIGDAIATESRPFSRHAVGEEAAALLERRASCTDAEYRARVWADLRGH